MDSGDGITVQRLAANGISINAAAVGSGPAVVLIHGWPHTWRLWEQVMPALATEHRVVAIDLRGLGDSDKPDDGYDLHTLADDVIGVLDALGIEDAAVVGIDLGAPVAWMTAMRHGGRIGRLVVMESLVGRLPGAEAFLAGGLPWWFGFHAVPDLAETVLAGHAGEYVDWFLRAGTFDGSGVSPRARDAFVAAYEDPRALHCGFRHYRALPGNAELIAAAAADHEIGIPVLALGANPVGDSLRSQLAYITEDLRGVVIPQCGHIIPEDAPGALLAHLRGFFSAGL